MVYAVYALSDPRTGDIRYIGQSCRINRRLRGHRQEYSRGKTYCDKWKRELARDGLCCKTEILITGLTKDEANLLEKTLIAYGKSNNFPLTNLTDGGEGTGGCIRTEETRRKIGDARRGKPLSVATRHKIGDAFRGKVLGPPSAEHRRKLADAQRGKVLSAETRQKIGDVSRGKVRGPRSKETREKMSKWQLGRNLSPETREKIGQAGRRRHASPETRERMRQARLAWWANRRNV